MGMENDVILSYLEDDKRFADLFNRFFFDGKQVVKAGELKEASGVYTPRDGKSGQRIRDIKKRLESGTCLKILAVEAQNDINYIMPWRIMDYDCREYERQIQKIQRENQAAEKAGEKEVYVKNGERLCKFRRSDRIFPVYTICLYHGTEKWDGPRSLKDMVEFGKDNSSEERQEWEGYFTDYPMRLICANEPVDCSGFRTSLKEVFALLPLRKDKKGLKALLQENPAYQKMDEETSKTISVLMGVRVFMGQQEKYKNEEGYNMCQAIKEMMEDSRMEGQKEEQAIGIRIFIQSNRDDGIAESDIARKLQKYYSMSEEKALEILEKE